MLYPAKWTDVVRKWTPRKFTQNCLILFTVCILGYVGLHHIFLGGLSPEWAGSKGYGQIARTLVDHQMYSENGINTTVGRPPLYPVFLAGFYAIFGPGSDVAAFISQSILWIGLGILLTRLALRWTNDQFVAASAAVLYATHIEFALEAISQRETLLFTSGIALWLSSLGRIPTKTRALKLGAASGLLLLTRPTGLVFCAIIPLLYLPWIGSAKSKHLFTMILIAGAAAFATTFPWHYHVRRTASLDLLPASTSGENLFKGHFDQFDTVFPWIDLDDINPQIKKLTAGLNERERNQKLKELGWTAIRAEPGKALRRVLVKIVAFYSPLRTPLGEGQINIAGDQWELVEFRINRLHFIMMPHALIMLIGTFVFIRSRCHFDNGQRRVVLQVGMVLLAVTALHALTFGETRHRLPFDLVFILATAAAIADRWKPHAQRSADSNTA